MTTRQVKYPTSGRSVERKPAQLVAVRGPRVAGSRGFGAESAGVSMPGNIADASQIGTQAPASLGARNRRPTSRLSGDAHETASRTARGYAGASGYTPGGPTNRNAPESVACGRTLHAPGEPLALLILDVCVALARRAA